MRTYLESAFIPSSFRLYFIVPGRLELRVKYNKWKTETYTISFLFFETYKFQHVHKQMHTFKTGSLWVCILSCKKCFNLTRQSWVINSREKKFYPLRLPTFKNNTYSQNKTSMEIFQQSLASGLNVLAYLPGMEQKHRKLTGKKLSLLWAERAVGIAWISVWLKDHCVI